MKEEKKQKMVRFPIELLEKITSISRHDIRNAEEQIIFFCAEGVRKFEKEHPGFFKQLNEVKNINELKFSQLQRLTSKKKIINGEIEKTLNILCIEDDPDGQKALSAALDYNEYNFKITNSGENAIELFNTAIDEKKPYNTLIIDYHLPGINGKELLLKLQEINPEIESILITGDTRKDIVNTFNKMEKPPVGFILKFEEVEKLESLLTKIQLKFREDI